MKWHQCCGKMHFWGEVNPKARVTAEKVGPCSTPCLISLEIRITSRASRMDSFVKRTDGRIFVRKGKYCEFDVMNTFILAGLHIHSVSCLRMLLWDCDMFWINVCCNDFKSSARKKGRHIFMHSNDRNPLKQKFISVLSVLLPNVIITQQWLGSNVFLMIPK